MSETTDTSTPTNQQMHRQAERAKTNLNEGVASSVPTGRETAPPPREDGLALRKAMFKKADAIRAGQTNVPVDPAAQAQIDAMVARATQDGPVVVQNNRQRLQQADQQEAVDAARRMVEAQQASTQAPDERLSLQLDGKTISVTRADIERAGGEALYLRQRRLDEAETQVIAERERLAQQRREFDQQVIERTTRTPSPGAPGQDGPATIAVDPTATVTPGKAGVDVAGMAKDLATRLYSGDQDEAAKAIEQILRLASARGETVNEEQIVNRVQAKLQTASAPAPTPAPAATVNPIIQAIHVKIDDMARSEFPELIKDEPARVAAWSKFQALCKLPENVDRRAVDVAREACEWAEAKFMQGPRGRIVEQKRTLQPASTASSAVVATEADETPLSRAEVIARMAESRQFGRHR